MFIKGFVENVKIILLKMQFQHSDTVFMYLAPETKCSSKNSVEEKFKLIN